MAKTFEVTILGVNSAIPVFERHPSCQIVNYDEVLYMVDCGEAAQIQISKYSIRKSKIRHIFISHLHGDHCFGLPGLLTSYALSGRRKRLDVHGPVGLKRFLDHIFDVSYTQFPFELVITEYDTEVENVIVVSTSLKVSTFPLKHRVPTMGFRFEELKDLNIKPETIKEFELSVDEIKAVKKGDSINRGGKEISNEELTFPISNLRAYSYCSDTVYDRDLIPFVKDSTLMYHETTYLDDMKHLARERMHSTLSEAIEIAKSAEVDRLVIGHYSSRYRDISVFLNKGKPLFENLLLGEEGRVYQV